MVVAFAKILATSLTIPSGGSGGVFAPSLVVGALIGGAIGAGVTVAHWLSKHKSAELPAGSEIVMELNRPMNLTAATSGK